MKAEKCIESSQKSVGGWGGGSSCFSPETFSLQNRLCWLLSSPSDLTWTSAETSPSGTFPDLFLPCLCVGLTFSRLF